jgi:hypothetical protein
MFAAVNNIKLNNQYAVSFKGQPNNSPFVILPTDEKARQAYLARNKEVASGGYADGDLSLSGLLARRMVSFWKLLTQDPKIDKEATQLEQQIRNIVKEDKTIGMLMDYPA